MMEPDISEPGYFTTVLAGKAFVVSGQLISRGAGNPIIVAAVPIREGERVAGIVSAAIELTQLADVLPAVLTNDPHVVLTRVKKACHSALCRIDKIQESDSLAVHLVGAEHK